MATHNSIFAENIEALRRNDSRMADALENAAASVIPYQLESSRSGLPTFSIVNGAKKRYVHSKVDPLLEAAKMLVASDVEGVRTLVICGLGLGYILKAIEKYYKTLPFVIIAIERSPEVLAEGLRHIDISSILGNSNFKLFAGDCADDLIPTVREPVRYIFIPPLFSRDENYYAHFLRRVMKSLVTEKSRKTLKIALHIYPFLFDSLKRTLRNMGHDVKTIRGSGNVVRKLSDAVPDIVVSVNLQPELAHACKLLHIPYAVIGIDAVVNSELLDPGLAADSTHLFLFNKSDAQLFNDIGYKNAFHFPLGTDTDIFKPVCPPPGATASDISFVGHSFTSDVNEYRESIVPNLTEIVSSASDTGIAEASERALFFFREALEKQCEDHFTYTLDSFFGANPERVSELRKIFSCETVGTLPVLLGKEASCRKRLEIISNIAARYRIDVYGDDGWREASGRMLKLHGRVPYGKLPDIYCASAINLNINRVYATDPVPLRVFDIAACGAFVMSDRSSDLVDIFEPDTEIGVFSSLREMHEKIDFFLDHPEQRKAAAERARKKVVEKYSLRHRLDIILDLCLE